MVSSRMFPISYKVYYKNIVDVYAILFRQKFCSNTFMFHFFLNSMQNKKILYENRMVRFATGKTPERAPESLEEIEGEREVLNRLKLTPFGPEFTHERLEQTFEDLPTEHLKRVSEHFAYSGSAFGKLSNESVIGVLETEILRRQTPDFNCSEFLNAFRVAWNDRKTNSKDKNGLHNLPMTLLEKGQAAFGRLFPRPSIKEQNKIFVNVSDRMNVLFGKRMDGATAGKVLDAMLEENKKEEKPKPPRDFPYPSVNPS